MQELVDIFTGNKLLILAIVIFILGLILLSYLLTTIIIRKKVDKKAQQVDSNKKVELDAVLDKMQKTIDEEPKKTYEYEDDQEKTAIISYEELLKAAQKDFPTKMKEQTEIKQEVLEPEVIGKDEKKFKNSIFISPIYGTQNTEKQVLKTEAEVNEEFLQSLKEFRSNL